MLMIKNEGMREAVEVVREMGLIRTLRWVYDDYWKAKRDRWARDEYVRDEARMEDILQLLEYVNAGQELPLELVQKIKAQEDEEILKRWHLSAAKAESVEQFMKLEKFDIDETGDQTTKSSDSP